jgi:exopolysaccharide biosynthesis polyprenyl glycosylphosphotransferase
VANVSDLEKAIRKHGAECLFVASTGVNVEGMRAVTKTARREGVQLRVSSNLPEVLARRFSVQPIGGVMALSVNPVRLTGAQAVVKRALDLALASFGLLLFLPFGLVIATLIKVTTRGPVFYKQERAGRHGRPFTMYKFRTMIDGADAMHEDLLHRNEASGPLFKIRDDPRVTTVGRWLRRWSVDEVPQLLNVVRGDMSLVGPRPALPRELLGYRNWHFDRLEVRPGITGLWQVSGRSALSFDEYVGLDLFYIQKWSLAYDLYILLKTLPVVLARKGAY